ncbi:TPA: hypothetical protein KIK79_002632 [Escherichia coli]|nr:hypothetical protein [Escherichia coli]
MNKPTSVTGKSEFIVMDIFPIMSLISRISQFHPTDVSPLTVLPVCRSANALTFLALIEISLEPSKPTPAIFRAVFSFVAVAALPDSFPRKATAECLSIGPGIRCTE